MSNSITSVRATDSHFFDTSRIRARWFYINLVAGPALLVSQFLPWFSTTGAGLINGHSGSFSAWQTFGALNFYLLWCGLGSITVAPWIAMRGDRLSWTPGELSIVFAIVGVFLIIWNGLFYPPGSPSGEIHLGVGFPIALAAAVAIVYSSVLRAGRHQPRRPAGSF